MSTLRRIIRATLQITLVVLVSGLVVGAFWFGLVPQRLSPFAPVSLEEPPDWFLDTRLAALRRDAMLCQSVLKEPHIDADAIPDQPFKDGCGWQNAVRFQESGGAKIGIGRLTCEMAAAFTIWVEHEVQPAAEAAFGQRVTGIEDMGTYDCRNIIGNKAWRDMRSQHASANATDIAGFTLADGRRVSVLNDWSGSDAKATFLKAIKLRSCRYFRVSLGPEANAAHKNHFHFDRGPLWSCR